MQKHGMDFKGAHVEFETWTPEDAAAWYGKTVTVTVEAEE